MTKNITWGEWPDWTYEEWYGQDVYVICDNMKELAKMSCGFWKSFYGAKVVGIGRPIKEIGEQAPHKGQFMRKTARTEEEAVATARKYRAKRIIMVHPLKDWQGIHDIEVVTTLQ